MYVKTLLDNLSSYSDVQTFLFDDVPMFMFGIHVSVLLHWMWDHSHVAIAAAFSCVAQVAVLYLYSIHCNYLHHPAAKHLHSSSIYNIF
jgi:hypothetical protein